MQEIAYIFKFKTMCIKQTMCMQINHNIVCCTLFGFSTHIVNLNFQNFGTNIEKKTACETSDSDITNINSVQKSHPEEN